MFWRILSVKLRNLDFIPTATWHHQSGERGQYQTATGMRRQWGMRGELLGGTTIGQTGVHWAWIRRKHPSQEAEAASTELSSWLDEGWEPRVDASHSLGQYFFSFSTSESPGRLVRIQVVGPTLEFLTQIWSRVPETAFLANSQEMLLLLVRGTHFEN